MPIRRPTHTLLPALLGLLLGQALAATLKAAEHRIAPGQAPQAVLDQAAPGDKLIFLPGLHEHGLSRHRAILYVDKPVHLELQRGAVLKLRAGECRRMPQGEITTDQDAGKKLDDLEIGGAHDGSPSAHQGPELYNATVYSIRISREGRNGEPDAFSWGDGKLFDLMHQDVPITGDWQALSHGVKIRFHHHNGHSKGSLWFVSYGGPEAYGIRIGHGTQPNTIEGVRISGLGTIDLNSEHNAQPSGLVKNINACVLIHGRVRDVRVEGISMTNTMRSVMCYGEHTGKFLAGGKTGPGESFDAENIVIERTRTINPRGSAYLLGHPSFRGGLRQVRCNHNDMITGLTAIEPNFNLVGYEVIGNVIRSEGAAIHCWRHSQDGVIADNLRVGDNENKPVVIFGAPSGWQQPQKPLLRNNRNHLSDPLPASPSRP